LIIYDTKKISSEAIKDHINNIHPAVKFTLTHEHNNRINFLDLTIIRHPSKTEINIYRKPTTTDTTINYTSNHPTEHKMAAYRYMVNRMLTLPLTTERRNNEWQKILRIVENNQYPLHLITRLRTWIQKKQQEPKTTEKEKEKGKKWATFTHHSVKVRTITNLFKGTDIKIAYKTTNIIQQRTKT
jgi:sugar diacid utilization regulator